MFASKERLSVSSGVNVAKLVLELLPFRPPTCMSCEGGPSLFSLHTFIKAGRQKDIHMYVHDECMVYIYIYIYIEREREIDR